jgi:hypothetical protein
MWTAGSTKIVFCFTAASLGVCTQVSSTCLKQVNDLSPCVGTSSPVVGCQNQACQTQNWTCVGIKIQEDNCTKMNVDNSGVDSMEPYTALCVYRVRTCEYEVCGACQDGDMAIFSRQCGRPAENANACPPPPPPGGGGGGPPEMIPPEE